MLKKKLTKKQKKYIVDCCLDEIDAAKESKRKAKRKGETKLGQFNTWITKQKNRMKLYKV